MPGGDVTQLLIRMGTESGEERKRIYDRVVTLVYQDLRRRARQQLAGNRSGQPSTDGVGPRGL